MNRLTVEIHGGGFNNKGDHLMLCAILKRLRTRFPDVRPVVEPALGNYEERAQLGLYQKMHERDRGRTGFLIDWLMHEGYRAKYGLVVERDVDAVLDASGFAYGDVWGSRNARLIEQKIKRWKAQGKPVIFLPQAYGPFERQSVREPFERAMCYPDFVCARDPGSLQHLKALGMREDRLALVPDLTVDMPGVLPDGFDCPRPYACIVPNTQMLRQTSPGTAACYLAFLADVLRIVTRRGLHPLLLRHEVRDDTALIDAIRQAADTTFTLASQPDPVHLKGIIGAADVVIGSRYHSLVSALSQAVPTLGTSWSHKYEWLFSDYGCREHLLHLPVSAEVLEARLSAMLDESCRSRLTEQLRAVATAQHEALDAMWHRVEKLLAAVVPGHIDRTR
jgi:polysaccharide pyruvyl transferase WcaK-like protein